MLVKNTSWSPRILAVGDRRIAMPARGVAELSAEEAASPELQRLLVERVLIALPESATTKQS